MAQKGRCTRSTQTNVVVAGTQSSCVAASSICLALYAAAYPPLSPAVPRSPRRWVRTAGANGVYAARTHARTPAQLSRKRRRHCVYTHRHRTLGCSLHDDFSISSPRLPYPATATATHTLPVCGSVQPPPSQYRLATGGSLGGGSTQVPYAPPPCTPGVPYDDGTVQLFHLTHALTRCTRAPCAHTIGESRQRARGALMFSHGRWSTWGLNPGKG